MDGTINTMRIIRQIVGFFARPIIGLYRPRMFFVGRAMPLLNGGSVFRMPFELSCNVGGMTLFGKDGGLL